MWCGKVAEAAGYSNVGHSHTCSKCMNVWCMNVPGEIRFITSKSLGTNCAVRIMKYAAAINIRSNIYQSVGVTAINLYTQIHA